MLRGSSSFVANAFRTSQIVNGSAARGELGNDNEWERGSLSFCVTLHRGFVFSPQILDLKLQREQLNGWSLCFSNKSMVKVCPIVLGFAARGAAICDMRLRRTWTNPRP